MIRQARSDDLMAIRRIVGEAYRSYVALLGKAPAPMVADFAAHIDQDWVIVFEREGVIQGYAILRTNEQRALLDNIAVDPACQRSGIGVALIEHVEQHAGSLGFDALELYTNVVMEDNVRWYEKLGFVETGRVDEAGFRRIYMRNYISDTR